MNFIEAVDLIFKYRTFRQGTEEQEETVALDGISLHINQGDFVGILGPNGSGKSTLAKQLAALLKPSGGVLYIKGRNSALEEERLFVRKTAGIVFQNPDNQLIGNTVEEDVAFGLENLGVPSGEMPDRISAALEAAGLSAHRLSSPGSLSGGEKQKTAIAGILAMEPECIVLDEPTAMLDPAGRRAVTEVVQRLIRDKGITIIYITHHADEVKNADYLYIMDQGRIAAQGSPCDVWQRDEEIYSLGIDPPFEQKIVRLLKRKGIKIGASVRSEDDLMEEIAAMLPRRRGSHGRKDAGISDGNSFR